MNASRLRRWQSLWPKAPRSRPGRRPRSPRPRLLVEPLEPRTLLNAGPYNDFLGRVYEDLLGRPADATGLAGWGALLDQGVSCAEVVLAIENSPEYQTAWVEGQYHALLGRGSDPEGLEFWVGLLAAGSTPELVGAGFLGSAEYFAICGGTGAEFLSSLYLDALDRPADADGLDFWGEFLAAQAAPGDAEAARLLTAESLLASPEAGAAVASGFYLTVLHRGPDPEGLAFWADAVQEQGELTVLAGFYGSDEFGRQAEAVPTPLPVEIRLDTEHVVSLPVGPEGGMLITTGADGTQFTLSIPPGAVPAEQVISMTPVAAIANLPLSDGLVAAAHFSPEGLQFFEPATLTIQVPAGLDATEVVGFGYQGDGTNFQLTPIEGDGSTVTLRLNHFSGAGVGSADLLRDVPISDAETIASFQIATLDAQAFQAGQPVDVRVLAGIFRNWYRTSVEPNLRLAIAVELPAALSDYHNWRYLIQVKAEDLGLTTPLFLLDELAAELQEGRNLAARALRQVIKEANFLGSSATVDRAFELAREALEWQSLAQFLNLATAANGLDRDTVLAGLCVQLDYAEVNFPQVPVAGQAATLRLRIGVSIGGRNPIFGQPINVTVDIHGTEDDRLTGGPVSGNGFFRTTVTPAGDAGVVLRIRAHLDVPGLREVEQQALVERGFVRVSPKTVSLASGASQQFSAEVVGLANQAVTWTATGGTSSSAGLFTAGSTAGTFTVTATSVANPNASGQASIQIQSAPNTLGIVGHWFGQSQGNFFGDAFMNITFDADMHHATVSVHQNPYNPAAFPLWSDADILGNATLNSFQGQHITPGGFATPAGLLTTLTAMVTGNTLSGSYSATSPPDPNTGATRTDTQTFSGLFKAGG